MNWLTVYLRADAEIAMPHELDSTRIAYDPIGPVVVTDAVMDGEEVKVPAVVDERFHANLYLHPDEAVPDWAKPYVIDAPNNPKRVLAGSK